MPTTGAKYPTLGESISEDPWSDNYWTTPTNIYLDDGATVSITSPTYDAGDQSWILKATGFDFSEIPDGSTIDGVICKINGWCNYTGIPATAGVDLLQLLNTSKAKVGTNLASPEVALTTDSATIITLGSSINLWGNALTAAWVKNANFGVALGCHAYVNNADVFFDYLTLEIYYTAPSVSLSLTDGLSFNEPVAFPVQLGELKQSSIWDMFYLHEAVLAETASQFENFSWGEELLVSDPLSWQEWEVSSGVKGTVFTDNDWGKLLIRDGIPLYSSVKDTGDTTNRSIIVARDLYGTGEGNTMVSIRGSATTFSQHDVLPAWDHYIAPVTKDWRFVQLKLEYSGPNPYCYETLSVADVPSGAVG